jgi:hypothetical protein
MDLGRQVHMSTRNAVWFNVKIKLYEFNNIGVWYEASETLSEPIDRSIKISTVLSIDRAIANGIR